MVIDLEEECRKLRLSLEVAQLNAAKHRCLDDLLRQTDFYQGDAKSTLEYLLDGNEVEIHRRGTPGALRHVAFLDIIELEEDFSARTFGPMDGPMRYKGLVEHINKELVEAEHEPVEWIDVIILALDGARRSGLKPAEIVTGVVAKIKQNMARKWPDWRTASPDHAIEHDRSYQDIPLAQLIAEDIAAGLVALREDEPGFPYEPRACEPLVTAEGEFWTGEDA